MTRSAKQAMAWARARRGDFGWDNLCLSFVRQAFGVYYSPDADWPTSSRMAGVAWDRAKKKHRETHPARIPAGVPVFFEMATEADHVVLSTGDGWCVSNDFVVDGRIDSVKIADIAAKWGPLLGWTEDLVGNTVWTPPKPPAPKPPSHTTLRCQLSPMQFSDTDQQMAKDIDDLFSRKKDVLGGTEAGGELSKPMPDLLRAAAKQYGYKLHIGRGDWVAVRKALAAGKFETGYVPVLESTDGAGKHTDRGIPWVSCETKHLGRLTVGAGHYLTNGRRPGDPNYKLNTRYADAIGEWAEKHGKGSGVVLYLGDQNIPDRDYDTFRGSPLTSCWDELEKYENTGHGNIDVIASYDRDGRVTCTGARALDDQEFRQNSDHFVTEAEYRVEHLEEKR